MDKVVSLLGLLVYGTNISVPLTGLHYDVSVTGFASHITINQTYKNNELADIECVYGFPINDYASVTGFVVKIDDRIINSQFKKKDEAFQEYSDAIKRGDEAYLLDQSDRSDDTFVLSVGRLPPQKECTVSISYVATLEFPSEKTLRLVIPTSLSPRYNPDNARNLTRGLFQEESTGDRSKGANPPEVYQRTVSYRAQLSADIKMFAAIQNISSPSHPLFVNLQGPSKALVSFGAEQQPLDRDIVIEIAVQSVPEHHVEVEQTGPNEFAALYSYVPKFHSGKYDLKAELIFVLDCSGSMDEEDKIADARRALKIFLRSIPEGSYFNFYRFGSRFESLFLESTLYSADSFARAENYVDESSANMGGTEILSPLTSIFANSPRSGFARQLFVLTDGDVTNTNAVIDLVKQNAYNTRVFSFGLGNSPSRSLVNGIALAGNGKSEFIKQGQVLEEKIGRQLRRALQPAVVEAAISWEGIGSFQQVPIQMPSVYRGDRQLAFVIFKRHGDADRQSKKAAVLKISGNRYVSQFSVPEDSDSKEYKQTIVKLAARALIKDLETRPTRQQMQGPTGSLQQRRPQQGTGSSTKDDPLAQQITEISLVYGVLSKYVSLVAVEKRNNADSQAGPMTLREIPVQKVNRISPVVLSYPQHSPGWFSGSRPYSLGMAGPPGYSSKGAYPASINLPHIASFRPRQHSPVQVASLDYSHAEAMEPQVPETANRQSSSPLSTLLNKQQWDGSWKYDQQVFTITGIAQNQLLIPNLTLQPDVLSTILVVEFVKEKYPNENSVWQLLVDKAMVFLQRKVLLESMLSSASAAVRRIVVAQHQASF